MTLNLTKLGLKQVINASGKMTILGVSKVSEGVLTAQRFGGEHFFEMSELAVKTGAYLAKLLQVEDAQTFPEIYFFFYAHLCDFTGAVIL